MTQFLKVRAEVARIRSLYRPFGIPKPHTFAAATLDQTLYYSLEVAF